MRNGTHPNASLESKKHEALNHAGLFRTKTYFESVGHTVINLPVTAADDFWRFAFRTGPLAHAMYVSCVMNSPHDSYWNQNSAALLNLYTVADESTVLRSASFNFGPGPTSGFTGAWSWKRVRHFDQMLPVSPNTDYYALLRRIQGAGIYSITAFELASMTENAAGYLAQNIGAQQPILDVYREKQAALLKQLWEGTDSKVFHWNTTRAQSGFLSGRGPAPDFTWKQTTDTTGRNILDHAPIDVGPGSSVVSASTPGWYPDMRNKCRRSQSGVPCVLKAFGYRSGASGSGAVELKDSTGAVVATATGWTSTPEWVQSSPFYLPATHAKYDVHFRKTGAGDFNLWAVSVYPIG